MQKRVFGAAAPFLLSLAVLAQTAPASKPVPPLPTAGAKPGQPPPPAHPLTTAQAREIMQLTGTDQVKARLIENVMQYTQRAFPPFVPNDVREDVRSSLQKMDVETPTVAIYQKYLSTEDAEKAIEFYKTPAGKNLLLVTPLLTNEIQQSTLKQGQAVFQAAMERHKTEIETAQKTYEQQHPATAPSLGPPSTPSTPGSSTTPGKSSTPATPSTKKPQ